MHYGFIVEVSLIFKEFLMPVLIKVFRPQPLIPSNIFLKASITVLTEPDK